MANDVLNLGEKIVRAARLAAIEHVRQEMETQGHPERRLSIIGDDSSGFKDESTPHGLVTFVRQSFGRFFHSPRQKGVA